MSPVADRRRHPRVPLFAQVQVRRDGEVHVLAVSDASRTGLFLSAEAGACPDVRAGDAVELLIFTDDLAAATEVVARGKLVRVDRDGDRPGLAVEILAIDFANLTRWESLLERVAAQPPADASAE